MMWRKTKFLGGLLGACVLFAFGFNVMAQGDITQLPLPNGQVADTLDRNGVAWGQPPTVGAYHFSSYTEGVMLACDSDLVTGKVVLTLSRDAIDSHDAIDIDLDLNKNDFYKEVKGKYEPCDDVLTLAKGATSATMEFFSYVSLGVERKLTVTLPKGVMFASTNESRRTVVVGAPQQIKLETGVENLSVVEGASNRFWIKSNLPLSPTVDEASSHYMVSVELNKAVGSIQSFEIKIPAQSKNQIYSTYLTAPKLLGRQFADGGEQINIKTVTAINLEKTNIGRGYVLSDARDLASMVLTTSEPVLKPGATVEFQYKLTGAVATNNIAQALTFPLVYAKDIFTGVREVSLASNASGGSFYLTVNTSLNVKTTLGIEVEDPYVGVTASALLPLTIAPRANLGVTLDWGTPAQTTTNVYLPETPNLYARIFDQETKLPFPLDSEVTINFSTPSLTTPFTPITILKGASVGFVELTSLPVINNLSTYAFEIDSVEMTALTTNHDKPTFIPSDRVTLNYFEKKQTIYVNQHTPAILAEQNGTSWPTAYATVQQALPRSVDEPKQIEIRVAAGTYQSDLDIIQGVNLLCGYESGTDNQTQTTIFSGKIHMASSNALFSSRIENCTFQQVVSIGANSTLKKVLIESQTRDTDILYINGGIVQNATIKKNKSTAGAVIRLVDGVIENSQIIGNTSTVNGGGVSIEKGTLSNNIIANNETPAIGGGVYATGDVSLYSNTIVRNKSKSIGGVFASTPKSKLYNNVIWGNGTGDQIDQRKIALYENNALEGTALSGGNIAISTDNKNNNNAPCFIMPSTKIGVEGVTQNDNWRIGYESRLASTGLNNFVYTSALDIDGVQRLLPNSIGAYEIDVRTKGEIQLSGTFNTIGSLISLTASMKKGVVREDVRIKLNYSDKLSLKNPPNELVIKAGEVSGVVNIETDVRYVGEKTMTISGELLTGKKVISATSSNLVSSLTVSGKPLLIELLSKKNTYHDGELMKISAKLPQGVIFAEPMNVWVNLGDQGKHFTLDAAEVVENKILLQIKAYETTSAEVVLRVIGVTAPVTAMFVVESNDFIASGANTKTFDLRTVKYFISVGATKSIYTQGEEVVLFAQLDGQMQNLTNNPIKVDMSYQPEEGSFVENKTLEIQPNAGIANTSLQNLSAGKYIVKCNEILSNIDSEVTQGQFLFEIVDTDGLVLNLTPKSKVFTEGDSVVYMVKITGNNGDVFVNNDTRIVYLTIPDTELKNTVDSFIMPIGASTIDVALGTAKQYLGAQGIRDVSFTVDSIQLLSTQKVDTFIRVQEKYSAQIDDTVKPLAKVEIFAKITSVLPGQSLTLKCSITDNMSDSSTNKIEIPVGFSDAQLWDLADVDSNKFFVEASEDGEYELLLYPKFNYQSRELITEVDFSTHASLVNIGTPKTQIVILPSPPVGVKLATSVASTVEGSTFDLIAQIVEPTHLYIQEGRTIQISGESSSTAVNLLRPVAFTITLSRQEDGSFKGSTPIRVDVANDAIMRTAMFKLQTTGDYKGTNTPSITIISNKAPTLSFEFTKANMWSDSYLFEGNSLRVTANLSGDYQEAQTVALNFTDTIFEVPETITFSQNSRKAEFILKAIDVSGFYGLRTSTMNVDSSKASLLMQLPSPITWGVVDSPLVNITVASLNNSTIYEGDSFDISATLDQVNTNDKPVALTLTSNGAKTDSRFTIKTQESTTKINYKTVSNSDYQGPQVYTISVDTKGQPYKSVIAKTYTIYDRDVVATFNVPDSISSVTAQVTVSLSKKNMSGKDVVVKLSSNVAGERLISIPHGVSTITQSIQFQPLPFGNTPATHQFKIQGIVGDQKGITFDTKEKTLVQYPVLRVVGISAAKTAIRRGEQLDFYVTMSPANDGSTESQITLALDPLAWGSANATVIIPPGKNLGRITLKSLDNMSEELLTTTVRVVEKANSVVKDPQKGETSVAFTNSLPIVSFEQKSTAVTFENVDEAAKRQTITLKRVGNLKKELYVNLSIVPIESVIKLVSFVAHFAPESNTATVEVSFENPLKATAPIEAILSFKNESSQYVIDMNSTHLLTLNSTIDPGVFTGFATTQQQLTFAIKPQLLVVWGGADRIELAISGKGVKSNVNCRLLNNETLLEFNRGKYIVRRLNNQSSTVLHVDLDADVLKTDNLAIKFKMTKATQGAWEGKVPIDPLVATHTLILVNDKPIVNNDLFVYSYFANTNPFVVFEPLKNDEPFVKENLSTALIIEGISTTKEGPFETSLLHEECNYRVTPDLTAVDMDYQGLSTIELMEGISHRLYYKVTQPGASSGVAFIDVALGSAFANQAIVPVSVDSLSLVENIQFPRAPQAYALYYDRFKDPLLLKPRKRTFSLEKAKYPTSTIRLKIASLPKLYSSKVLSKAMSGGRHLSQLLADKALLFQYDNVNMPIQVQLKGITGTPIANAQTFVSIPAKISSIADTVIKDYSGYTLIELKGESFSQKPVVYLAYRKIGYEKVYRTKLPVMKSYKNMSKQKITFPITDPVSNCSIYVRLPKTAPKNSVSYELQFENGVGFTPVEFFDLNQYLKQK